METNDDDIDDAYSGLNTKNKSCMYTIFRTFYLCCSYNFSSQLFPAHEAGVRMIALRCAGFDRVDLKAAEQHGITVARVPAYSNLSANCIRQKLETEPKN